MVLGQSASFFVSATGSPPFRYDYFGLPSGCLSVNASSIGCTPNATGMFSVVVEVTDPNHLYTTANTTIAVTPAPGPVQILTLTMFTASPSVIQPGQTTYFLAYVNGGTLPYQYVYYDLPPGCRSSSNGYLPCSPASAGVYDVILVVYDASNSSTQGDALLTVEPGTTPNLPFATPLTLSWVDIGLLTTTIVLAMALVATVVIRRYPPPPPPA
jgi:hypothetical protein